MRTVRATAASLTACFNARTVDELECVVSVLLAILFAHLAGATNVSWAAFAGYMVMRGHAADTLTRGLLRIVGTVIGGLLALALVPHVAVDPLLAMLALVVIGGGSLYAALTARRAYAWLFFGLTFAMVLLDSAAEPNLSLHGFVTTRVIETVAGTLACLGVSLLSGLTLRRRWPADRLPPPPVLGWHPQAFRQAVQGAGGLVLLSVLAMWFHIPALTQAAITIIAVMLLPVASVPGSAVGPISVRLVQRMAGCLLGAGFAALLLVLAHGAPPVLIAGTALGVAIGRHLENSTHPHRYVGTQLVLALLIVAVPDDYGAAEIGPGIERLIGILVGMAVLEPVLIACHFLWPNRASAEAGGEQPHGSAGDI